MKSLEEIVLRHKESFDDLEPNEGHFERFESRLNKQKTKTVEIKINVLIRVAAAVLILISGAIWIIINQTSKTVPYNGYTQEIQEVEYYYSTLVSEKMSQIKQYSNDPELKEKLIQEEFNELDSLNNVLQKELKTTPGDERVINAIISHYQTKVEILNQILDDLQSIKHIKTEDHESTEI